MDRVEQEQYIDIFLSMWKEQMLKMPGTIPVVMLYANLQRPFYSSFGIFINATFQNIYMMLLETWMKGDLPLETDLFPPDELCCFKLMRYPGDGLTGVPYLCSHTRLEHGGDDYGACQVADCDCEAWTQSPILTAADFEEDEEEADADNPS